MRKTRRSKNHVEADDEEDELVFQKSQGDTESEEELDLNQNPQPSSSSQFRQRRSILTPSPLCSDSDSTTGDEDVRNRNTSRRIYERPKPAAKRRSDSTDRRSTKRKKTSNTPSQPITQDVESDISPSPLPVKKPRNNRTATKVKKPLHVNDEFQPSQRSQSSQYSSSQFNGINSHPGVIKSLTLQNFMCHSNFTHNFHPNLNFITGQNGSGKSALLSGILIALGGKAAVTSRTSSLKSLIQKGKNVCRVSVTLLNKGGLRRFGDEITIERSISISGGGSYRLLDSNTNQWKPLKKHELDSILLGLNIQIDNPVAILNQEVARSFLRSKDPKVKFNLFYNGTLLGKLETTLEEIDKDVEETKTILSSQCSIINQLRTEIEELKLKLKKVAELNQIKDKLSSLNNEYLWSLVIEQEEVVAEVRHVIVKAEKELDLLSKNLKEAEESYENLNEDSIRQEQAQVREQLEAKKVQLDQISAKARQLKNNFAALRVKLRTTTSTVATKEAQIQKLDGQIERLKAEQNSRNVDECNQEEQRKTELEEQKRNMESVYNTIKADTENFQQAGELERQKLQELETQTRTIKTNIEGKKRMITALNDKTSNKYSVFGPKMQQLMVKVQANKHKFRKPPRGPLGACFTVKDPAYVGLVEAVLSSVLESFVVDNANDLNLLRELIDSVYRDRTVSQRASRASGQIGSSKMPGIIMCAFADQMYDVSRNIASHRSAATLLELLNVENNDYVVTNALIDTNEVERILMFKDNVEASRVLKSKATCPKTLKLAYTLDWFKFTPLPHFAARVMTVRQRAEILRSGKGSESQIISLKSEIGNLVVQLKDMEPLRKELQAEETKFRKAHEVKVNELSSVRRQLGEIMNEIKRHINKVKQREKHFDFSSYYDELNELREELQAEIVARDLATKELETAQPDISDVEGKRKRIDKEYETLSAKMSEFDESRDELKTKKAEYENVIKKVRAKLVSLESTRSSHKKDLSSKQKTLEEKLALASRTCPVRVDTEKSSDELQTEYESFKIRMKEAKSRLGDVEKLQMDLCNNKEKYRELIKEYKPISQLLSLIRSTSDFQRAAFDRLKTHVRRTLTMFFSVLSEQRGYKGQMLVDYAAKELYYFVCPDGDSSKKIKAFDLINDDLTSESTPSAVHSKQRRNQKRLLVEYSLQLSGGERSFSTICFIMALWQVMECPFYMLDEFDVFMDAINRKASQTALMAHAKKFNMNQFILFTPLELGQHPEEGDACVLRLFPPVRGSNRSNGSRSGGQEEASSNTNNNSAPGTSASFQRRSDGSIDDPVENVDPLVEGRQQQKRRAAATNDKPTKRRATKVMGVSQK